ncbi:glycosyltransferase family 2 protein [Glutamicibacter ardleyensis]|uniref:glycosyltransferase family 2 protein n=1 Tax=Glutamicibacter ardleyensis TaxID=225894 RepID=UPI003FD64467
MNDEIDVSVVIGFKDWGIERLELSVKSLAAAFGELNGEVIISDFGSVESLPIKELATKLGAVYHRTDEVDGWSRSRAINAGYDIAQGRILVATDADMLFSPNAMQKIVEFIDNDPNASVVLQCRDLPEGYSHTHSAVVSPDWRTLEMVSQIRPRWGMGGMFAAHRNRVMDVGGYENRMHTYGGEDLDFAQRIRRSGSAIHWIEDSSVRMYHIWHPATIRTVEESAEGKAAVEFNRSILRTDKTWKRNSDPSPWRMARASRSCTLAIHLDADEVTNDYLSQLLPLRNFNLEVILLTSSIDSLEDFKASWADGIEEFIVIKSDSLAESYKKALESSTSPFFSLISKKTSINPDVFNESLAEFFGSTSGVISPCAHVTSLEHTHRGYTDIWSSVSRIQSNSLLIARTDILRAIGSEIAGVEEWRITSIQKLVRLRAEIRSGVNLVGIVEEDEPAIAPELIEKMINSQGETGLKSFVMNSSFAEQIEIHRNRFIPREIFSRGILVTGTGTKLTNEEYKEILSRGRSTIVIDQNSGTFDITAFIPNIDPIEINNILRWGLEIEYLTSAHLVQKQLLSSLSSAQPVDHLIRHLFETTDLSEENVSVAMATVFDPTDQQYEDLLNLAEDTDLIRTIIVDDKVLSSVCRVVVSDDEQIVARRWLANGTADMICGFISAGSLPVVSERIKKKVLL